MKKKFTVCVIIFLSFFCKPNLVCAQVNVRDSLVLIDLFIRTNGRHWTNHANWLTKAPVSTWYGITVYGRRVSKVVLSNNWLKGKIPASLGNLNELTDLVLDRNYLRGNIPVSISKLSNLVNLNLYYNHKLSGNIPSLTNLQNLQYLNLGFNNLTGNIPGELGSLSKVKSVYLSSNKLTGDIPEFERLDSLVELRLSVNKLTGSIPVSISKLKNLQHLDLWSNQLTGSIPPVLNILTNLTYIDIGWNELSGTIPSLNKLQYLNTLDLSFNKFTFDGMEPIAKNFPFAQYGGQAYIPIHINNNTLSVSAGGTLSRNKYTWYKEGHIYAVIKGDSTLTIKDSGTYWVAVTNSIAKESILYSEVAQYDPPDDLSSSMIHNLISEIDIYPNPANAHTILSFMATGKFRITVTDLKGKILTIKTGVSGKALIKIKLDVSTYLPGMYMVCVTDEKKKQFARLLVK